MFNTTGSAAPDGLNPPPIGNGFLIPCLSYLYKVTVKESGRGFQDCSMTARICCFFVGRDSERCALDKTVTILRLLIDERTLEDIRYRWDCALVILQLFRRFAASRRT